MSFNEIDYYKKHDEIIEEINKEDYKSEYKECVAKGLKLNEVPKIHTMANNQLEIITENGIYFQSYDSIIAFIPNIPSYYYPKIYLDLNKWNYSKTTLKYLAIFLDGYLYVNGKKDIINYIKEGKIILTDLNK